MSPLLQVAGKAAYPGDREGLLQAAFTLHQLPNEAEQSGRCLPGAAAPQLHPGTTVTVSQLSNTNHTTAASDLGSVRLNKMTYFAL